MIAGATYNPVEKEIYTHVNFIFCGLDHNKAVHEILKNSTTLSSTTFNQNI